MALRLNLPPHLEYMREYYENKPPMDRTIFHAKPKPKRTYRKRRYNGICGDQYKYWGCSFTKIYWSKMATLHKKRGSQFYVCDCCRKHPLECENQKSVAEYKKLQELYEKCEFLENQQVDNPSRITGWVRSDMSFGTAQMIWKVQREHASLCGFELHRCDFW